LRIVVVGDFHIHSDELDITECAIEDINDCAPDLVIPLGDFGSNTLIGSVEGMDQAFQFLGRIQAPLRPILGNHDLQRETGGGRQRQGTMEQKLLELFKLDAVNGVIEGDHIRLFFAGTDPQPKDSCYQIQECYVTDEHFDEIIRKLNERPEVPVIFFTHAPPVGAALRTVPSVHVRATNAYLDQNHQFERWNELIRSHPQIVMWFSAHYHLGQHYPDSMTVRYGVRFVHTGVHGSCTRDGKRQSRVIDIDLAGGGGIELKVQIRTLDHEARCIYDLPDWSGVIGTKLQADSASGSSFKDRHLQPFGARLFASYPIGEGAVIPGGIVSLDPEYCLVATEDGFLWEALHRLEAVMGTLHYGQRLDAVVWNEDGVWRAWDRKIAYSNMATMDRFVCEWQKEDPIGTMQLVEQVGAIASDGHEGVWVACGQTLLKIGKAGVKQLCETGVRIVKLIPDGENVALLTKDGRLIQYSHSDSRLTAIRQLEDRNAGWVDWEISGDEEIGVYGSNGMYFVKLFLESVEIIVPLPIHDKQQSPVPLEQGRPELLLYAPLEQNLSISIDIHAILLGSGYYLVLQQGIVYVGRGGKLEVLGNQEVTATAIARMPATSNGIRFSVALKANGSTQRPLLQVWELS
jgi:Icc-related predicted phosphoesterase